MHVCSCTNLFYLFVYYCNSIHTAGFAECREKQTLVHQQSVEEESDHILKETQHTEILLAGIKCHGLTKNILGCSSLARGRRYIQNEKSYIILSVIYNYGNNVFTTIIQMVNNTT